MPRSFTAGNGEMLVGLDAAGQLRDLYYPHIGLENHVGKDCRHRMGVFVDGEMYWLDDDFIVSVSTARNTLATDITARCQKAGVTLSIRDVVYNEKPVFVREVEVKNNWDVVRDIKLFFCQEFRISQSQQASTAYFDPINQCLIHYRGQRAFLINAVDADGSFSSYTTGVYGIEGKEGSWRDAEDGQLTENAIEHGPADSCLMLEHTYQPQSSHQHYYWIAAGTSIQEVADLNDYVTDRTPEHLLETTTNYWQAWLTQRPFDFHDLSDEVVALFNQSLLTLRSHADADGGILASSDSDMLQRGKDSYGYVWPRDGAFIVAALDRVGDSKASQRFFTFLESVLTDDGYVMHKYGPDGSLGSSWHPWFYEGAIQLPIQEDETAVMLHALWNHYEHSKDLEFIEQLYNPLIRASADFLTEFRNSDIDLPQRSYDLWEEQIGVHTYTASSVYGGLVAAAKFARLLGKAAAAARWEADAEKMKQAILRYLYDEEAGYFIKGGEVIDNEFVQKTTIDSSSTFGVWHFGVLPVDDERVISSMEHTKASLGVAGVGGFARYAGDQYYRDDADANEAVVPGNPWFVTTLWYAQYLIEKAQTAGDLAEVRQIFSWVVERATPAGMLPEQLHPHTAAPLSATPLVWSHAAFVTSVDAYINKLAELSS